jgi:hypothetical protein
MHEFSVINQENNTNKEEYIYNLNKKITFPVASIICSMKIEMASNTKHTPATAHVGVSAIVRSSLPS